MQVVDSWFGIWATKTKLLGIIAISNDHGKLLRSYWALNTKSTKLHL